MTEAESRRKRAVRLSSEVERLQDDWVSGSKSNDDAAHAAHRLCEELVEVLSDEKTPSDSLDARHDEETRLAAEKSREVSILVRAIELTAKQPLGGDSSEMVRRLNLRRAATLLGPIGPERLY